jgi:hypothetical protein
MTELHKEVIPKLISEQDLQTWSFVYYIDYLVMKNRR